MTVISLVRHGETDWNARNILQGTYNSTLNEIGKKQALEASKQLSKNSWDMIITSPLQRALETADIISKQLNIKNVMVMKEFSERDYGEATGMPIETFTKKLYKNYSFKCMESDDKVLNRVHSGLEFVQHKYDGKRIILVSHGVTILAILQYTLGKALHFENTLLKNCSIHHIYKQNGNWYSTHSEERFNI